MRVAFLVPALVLLTCPSAAGLTIRDAGAPPAPAPAGAPGPSPGPAPGPAAAPIRPGIAVRVTSSKEGLQNSFKGLMIRYDPLMDEMLGKDFVVKSMGYGGAGIASADGTQGDTWYFPIPALTPWTSTDDARTPPVAGAAAKVVGLPTRARVDIGTPGRHDAPWDFTVKGRNLLDPVAPHHNEQVDLVNSAMPMPAWTKVKQVISVECMDKMHKDPTHLCDPKDYNDFNAVTTKPTIPPPMPQSEANKLKKKIKRMEGRIKSLSPKKMPEEPKELTFKAPAAKKTEETMNTMGAGQDSAQGGEGKDMKMSHEAPPHNLPEGDGDPEHIVVKYD